jgi:hypothetical protein
VCFLTYCLVAIYSVLTNLRKKTKKRTFNKNFEKKTNFEHYS